MQLFIINKRIYKKYLKKKLNNYIQTSKHLNIKVEIYEMTIYNKFIKKNKY